MGQGQGRVTLWGIEVFLTVIEEGAISAAARRLGVSASAISQQVTAIEAAFGAALIDRGARPLAATPAGLLLRAHAQTMLRSENEARAELAMADLSSPTTLRLGVIEDFDAEVTPRLLSVLAKQLSGCRFLLETGASHRLLDQLETRALDLVVTAEYGQARAGEDDWRVMRPLMQEPFIAILPARGGMELPFIQYTTRHLMGQQIASHLAAHGLARQVRFEVDSYAAILSMVAAGEGWTILTPLALQHGERVAAQLRVEPLPVAPLQRRLTVSARQGMFGQTGDRVLDQLRALIAEVVVDPALERRPWLAPDLCLL